MSSAWSTSSLSCLPSHPITKVISIFVNRRGQSFSCSPSTSTASDLNGCLNFLSRSTAFRPVQLPRAPSNISAGRLTAERGIKNVEWVLGDALRLPFADATFDLYTVRAAPHHFPDIDAFLHEAFRVLRPGRHAVFVDCAPPAEAREVLHEVEVRRDPSHVRSLTVDEWVENLEHAGFEVGSATERELDWDFEDWMGNMAVAEPLVRELAEVLESASGEARRQLHPERRDGRLWHAYWHCLIRAERPE